MRQVCLNSNPFRVIINSDDTDSAGYLNDNLSHIEYLLSEVNLWIANAYLDLMGFHHIDPGDDSLAVFKIPCGISELKSIIEGIAPIEKEDLIPMIKRLRKINDIPLLFGNTF